MQNRTAPRVLGLLLMAALFYHCSSDTPGKRLPGDSSAAPPNPDFVTITIENMKFSPDSIEVKKGQQVVFVNRDMVNHCITEVHTKAWTSGVIPAGGSWMWVASQTSDYYCAIHAVMKGKIIVR